MAKHMVKCLYCGKMFDANAEPYEKPTARRYAHLSCYQEYEQQKTQEQADEEDFYKYVQNLFGKQYNFIATKKLANQYIKKYNYTYSGMKKSLTWFYEIKKNPIIKANGSIGIVPYVYEEAKKYYYALYLTQMKNTEQNISKINYDEQIIEISSPQTFRKPHRLFQMEEDE